jgi:hypothetical protein
MISYGDGIDTGDKAPGKAMTYSDKYSLLKAYKVATGDDPDKDASPTDKGYSKTNNKVNNNSNRILLINKINELELDLNIPHDKVLETYKVDTMDKMTNTQLNDCIKKLEEVKERK